MARHGENIRKRKDGRWEGRYLVYSEVKRKKYYRSVYGKTYEEVRDKVYEAKRCLGSAEPEAGTASLQNHVPPGSRSQASRHSDISCKWMLTQSQPHPVFTHPHPVQKIPLSDKRAEPALSFSRIAMEWLDQVKATRKFSTYAKYKQVFENYLEDLYPDMELSSITDWRIREQLPDSLTESMEKSIYCVLNQILGYASRQYSIAIPNMKRPLTGTRNKPVVVLARKEQMKLLSALYQEPDPFRTAVSLCLHTGLRLGEVCALKWSDIDFDNRLVTVGRTVQRLAVDGARSRTMLLELAPKSEYSRREIPLSGPVLELLRLPGDKEYIFGGDKPMDPRTMQYRFKKFLKRAGLPNRNFHILRHTFATNCIEEGADVKSLSEILGHSDVKITLNRYVHPSMDTKRRHMDSLSGFYGQIYGQKD